MASESETKIWRSFLQLIHFAQVLYIFLPMTQRVSFEIMCVGGFEASEVGPAERQIGPLARDNER